MTPEQLVRSQDATARALRMLISEVTEEVLQAIVAWFTGHDADSRTGERETYAARERRSLLEMLLADYVSNGHDPMQSGLIRMSGLLDRIRAALEVENA